MNSTNTFSKRYNLSEEIVKKLPSLFDLNQVEIIPFGVETIANGNQALNEHIKKDISNLSHSSMLVKFAPDFILLKKAEPQALYFLEIKVSVTPLYSSNRLNEINTKHPGTKLSDVGDIAREAWNAYKTLFPNTIILEASTYNPKLFMAQFANKITCLRCHADGNLAYDCSQCPVNKRDFFPVSRNKYSSGSQTPHTNISLASFMDAKQFFNQLNINLNDKIISEIKTMLMNHKISWSSSIYPTVIDKCKITLIKEGCYWLK